MKVMALNFSYVKNSLSPTEYVTLFIHMTSTLQITIISEGKPSQQQKKIGKSKKKGEPR